MARTRTSAPPLRSSCPIGGALDLIGDRWTLLVLRDALILGKSLFQDFLTSPERISSNTLTARLKRLERCGILCRVAYQRRPARHRYEPTERGRELFPLLREAALWGSRHVKGTRLPSPEELRRAGPGPQTAAEGPMGARRRR